MALFSNAFSTGLGALDYLLLAVLLFIVNKVYTQIRRRMKTTVLRGPLSRSWFYGLSLDLQNPDFSADMYEEWITQYGDVFTVPTALGGKTFLLADPKAIAHVYAGDTFGYVQTALARVFSETIVRIT